MSMSALLAAVEARLRSAAVLDDPDGRASGVQPDGKPPPFPGQFYFAAHGLGITGDDPNALSNDRLFNVGVTITARMAYAPGDRRGSRMLLDQQLLERAEFIADALHMDYVTMNDANARITGFGTTVNGFVEPLKLADITQPDEAPADWVKSNGNECYVCAVRLVGARRVRPL